MRGLVPPSRPATPASKGIGLLFDSEPSVAAPHRGPDETMTMATTTLATWSASGVRHEAHSPRAAASLPLGVKATHVGEVRLLGLNAFLILNDSFRVTWGAMHPLIADE